MTDSSYKIIEPSQQGCDYACKLGGACKMSTWIRASSSKHRTCLDRVKLIFRNVAIQHRYFLILFQTCRIIYQFFKKMNKIRLKFAKSFVSPFQLATIPKMTSSRLICWRLQLEQTFFCHFLPTSYNYT